MSNFIEKKVDDKGICIISLNRAPVNALSYDLLYSLREVFENMRNDKKVKVVIINSQLDHFSAGADLKERKIMSKKDASSALDNFNDCFNAIESFPAPVICLINGYCLGGGAELSLACDFRIGSEDCLIGFPEVSIGIIPGAGGTQRLPKAIGMSNAKYWIYTAKKFNNKESLDYGFLNFTASKSDLLKKGIELAEEILINAPIAVKSSKKSINDGYNSNISDGLEIERFNYNISLNTKDRDEALDAFINKRKPNWSNE